jgi:hypothetical protein
MRYFVFSFLFLLGAYVLVGRVRHARLYARSREAVARNYESSSSVPQVRLRYMYGFPAFEIAFDTKEHYSAAAESGLNASIAEKINRLCKHMGSAANPFDAKRAIFFTYPGRKEELRRGTGA